MGMFGWSPGLNYPARNPAWGVFDCSPGISASKHLPALAAGCQAEQIDRLGS